ncbi:MAG TPA: biotin/lipoyl-binding protein [Candidatus Saccharimonadales bacterium]|nr:biotin/lipoyl-binding protein [Candidatus Saccharimonadales bacterium]
MNKIKALPLKKYRQFVTKKTQAGYKSLIVRINKHPLPSFFVALGVLLVLIILANIVGAPKAETGNNKTLVKAVSAYHIGSAPKVSLSAKINKSGVITMVAQSAGVVSYINVAEGDTVYRGTTLVDLSTNYQGGDASSIQAQIAQAQYNNVKDSFDEQMDLINRQRDVATASATQANDLRDISAQSVGETNDVISQDQALIDSFDQAIQAAPTSSDAAAPKQMKAQLQAGVNQLREAIRQTQYQTDTSKTPALLTDLQKQITLKQLDIQEKSLKLNREVSGLQVNLANVTAALMHPASPVNGTVERVFVNQGQAVTPGTTIAVIKANDVATTAVVTVPANIAKTISHIESSVIHIGDKTITALPRFVSTEATDGSNYTAIYDIPTENQKDLSNTGYITVDVPLGNIDTDSTIPFIPIDSVYQSEDSAYIYVIKHGKAQSRSIELGNVLGRFVEVKQGLHDGDQVITNRNIIAGDSVKE